MFVSSMLIWHAGGLLPPRGCHRDWHRTTLLRIATLYVATMSHVIAVILCKPLKQDGNVCGTMRHENGLKKLHKQLILLAIPAGLEPATRGVEIRYSSRFLILIENPKVMSVLPTTD